MKKQNIAVIGFCATTLVEAMTQCGLAAEDATAFYHKPSLKKRYNRNKFKSINKYHK